MNILRVTVIGTFFIRENRLRFVLGNKYAGFYGYDAGKEVDAYKAQWGWRGSPLDIPIDDGKHPYPVPAHASYLDINSDLINSITTGWLDKDDKLYHFK